MKTKQKIPFLLLLSAALLSTGCHSSVLPPTPDVGIPEAEMNRQFHLDAPLGWNDFKIGESVVLRVDVVSDNQITFRSDYGARVFILENQQWVEISNLMEYPEGSFILSPSKGDPSMHAAASLFPDLPDTKKAVTIRIVLIGNIYRNGETTDERTGTFIDFKLRP